MHQAEKSKKMTKEDDADALDRNRPVSSGTGNAVPTSCVDDFVENNLQILPRT